MNNVEALVCLSAGSGRLVAAATAGANSRQSDSLNATILEFVRFSCRVLWQPDIKMALPASVESIKYGQMSGLSGAYE